MDDRCCPVVCLLVSAGRSVSQLVGRLFVLVVLVPCVGKHSLFATVCRVVRFFQCRRHATALFAAWPCSRSVSWLLQGTTSGWTRNDRPSLPLAASLATNLPPSSSSSPPFLAHYVARALRTCRVYTSNKFWHQILTRCCCFTWAEE